jgi:hypothetical protein
MSIYSHALLQELSRDLARVIDSLLLYVFRPAPLTPAAQSAYVTSLASQLLVAIRTFVNLHPNIHTNSTPPDIGINGSYCTSGRAASTVGSNLRPLVQ